MERMLGSMDGLNDKFREECGLFGVASSRQDAPELTFFGLHALQHRGQESAGIVVGNGQELEGKKGMGLVTQVFDRKDLDEMDGKLGIGHVRYSTTGASLEVNAQPLLIRSLSGSMALAHNGNLTNSQELRQELENAGSIFHSTLDTEILAHLLARPGFESFEQTLCQSLLQLQGAYALVILRGDTVYGARDPQGFRPLILGKIDGDYLLASESCAFHTIGGRVIREIEPGEIVKLKPRKIESIRFSEPGPQKFCVFEYIYFARPDSSFSLDNVHRIRQKMGRQLADEYNPEGDIVIPVPDSGNSAAQGYARARNLPFELALIKNKYVGRSFIMPRQDMRETQVKLKLSPIRELIEGKRVILIDDSLVRGTTSRYIVKMVRDAGAREVHLGISSPPVSFSCYYGLDTTRRKELIAAQKNTAEIGEHVGVDSLGYLSLEGLQKMFGENMGYCDACFSGNYPLAGEEGNEKRGGNN